MSITYKDEEGIRGMRVAGRLASELLDYLTPKVAKWWLPNDVVFVTELPHTGTGKVQKKMLREMFKGYRFEV